MFRLNVLGHIDLRDKAGTEVQSILAQPKRLALPGRYGASVSPLCPRCYPNGARRIAGGPGADFRLSP